MYAALIVSLLAMSGSSCVAVDPLENTAAWNLRGKTRTATYVDRGIYLEFNRPTPYIVREVAHNNKGTAIRVKCINQ